MLKKTELRKASYGWIENLPHGGEFEHVDTYHFLETNFAVECDQRGDAKSEPRYKVTLAGRSKMLSEKRRAKQGSLRKSAMAATADCDSTISSRENRITDNSEMQKLCLRPRIAASIGMFSKSGQEKFRSRKSAENSLRQMGRLARPPR
jgi:hypothetical protein